MQPATPTTGGSDPELASTSIARWSYNISSGTTRRSTWVPTLLVQDPYRPTREGASGTITSKSDRGRQARIGRPGHLATALDMWWIADGYVWTASLTQIRQAHMLLTFLSESVHRAFKAIQLFHFAVLRAKLTNQLGLEQ